MHEKEPLLKGKTRFRKEAIVSYTPVGIALTTSPAKAIAAHTGISCLQLHWKCTTMALHTLGQKVLVL